MQFVKKIIKAQNSIIYLVTGKEQGKDSWFYVRVSKLKEPLLKAALEKGELNVPDYGDIIYSGWGVEPDEEIAALVEGEDSN